MARAGATVANGVISLGKGVANLGENIFDLVTIAGTGVASVGTGIYDIATGKHETENMWKETMSFVAKEHVNNAFADFYKNNQIGKWLDEHAIDAFKSYGTGSQVIEGLSYTAGLVALTVATAGIGGAVTGGGSATAAAITSNPLTISAFATAAGTGKYTQEYWAKARDNANGGEWRTLETGLAGLGYGLANGVWEGAQYYTGAKITGMSIPGATAFQHSLARVGLDTGFNALDTPARATTSLLADHLAYGTKITQENWSKAFEAQGGWNSVIANVGIGAIGSIGGEAFNNKLSAKTEIKAKERVKAYDIFQKCSKEEQEYILERIEIAHKNYKGNKGTESIFFNIRFSPDAVDDIITDRRITSIIADYAYEGGFIDQHAKHELINGNYNEYELRQFLKENTTALTMADENRILQADMFAKLKEQFGDKSIAAEKTSRFFEHLILDRGMDDDILIRDGVLILKINDIDWHQTGTSIHHIERVLDEAPQKLKDSVKSIEIYDIASPHNSLSTIYYDMTYDRGLFASRATATMGEGEISIWAGSQLEDGTIYHEMGHLFDADLGTFSENDTRWLDAMTRDSNLNGRNDQSIVGCTDYATQALNAANTNTEDFAEAIELYLTDNENFRRTFPNRYQVIHDLLE